jgi:hypothetical protein
MLSLFRQLIGTGLQYFHKVGLLPGTPDKNVLGLSQESVLHNHLMKMVLTDNSFKTFKQLCAMSCLSSLTYKLNRDD